jgi:tetratricopeptide (TPR) repeat protein
LEFKLRQANQGFAMKYFLALLAFFFLSQIDIAAADIQADCVQTSNPEVSLRGCSAVIGQVDISDEIKAKAYYNRGRIYKLANKIDLAIADYSAAIHLKLNYPSAFSNRGNIYASLGRFTEAIKDYNQAIALDQTFWVAINNRGLAWQALGNFDSAIADYSAAIQLSPNFVDGYYNRGSAYEQLQRFALAIADYNEVIRLEPSKSYGYLGRCFSGAKLGKDLHGARSDCDKALALSNNDANSLGASGFVALRQALFERAWADYDAALRSRPNVAAYLFGRGIAARQTGRIEQGNADFARATQIDINIALVFSNFDLNP